VNSSTINPDEGPCGLIVQEFPCICTIKLSDRDTGGIFSTHHPRVDSNPAIVIRLDAFIVRGAATGFAVIERYAPITP
ncbi:MAG: hypothetical protein QNK19_13345, partial [Xanthomonadales bacterium]|nr:hypothetical protein [Xanthomonadales bacterium]